MRTRHVAQACRSTQVTGTNGWRRRDIVDMQSDCVTRRTPSISHAAVRIRFAYADRRSSDETRLQYGVFLPRCGMDGPAQEVLFLWSGRWRRKSRTIRVGEGDKLPLSEECVQILQRLNDLEFITAGKFKELTGLSGGGFIDWKNRRRARPAAPLSTCAEAFKYQGLNSSTCRPRHAGP